MSKLNFTAPNRGLKVVRWGIFFFAACYYAAATNAAGVADYVIQISVDGMGSSYLQMLINEGKLPNFKRTTPS